MGKAKMKPAHEIVSYVLTQADFNMDCAAMYVDAAVAAADPETVKGLMEKIGDLREKVGAVGKVISKRMAEA